MMKRSDLIAFIAAENPQLSNAAADLVVRTVFQTIAEQLARGGRVELRGFGAFDVKRRQARIGRNPRTGEAVPVAEKSVVFFKTGKDLHDRLNADADADADAD